MTALIIAGMAACNQTPAKKAATPVQTITGTSSSARPPGTLKEEHAN